MSDYDDNPIPTTDSTPVSSQREPGETEEVMAVPRDLADAGTDTNITQADSPESLDQEIAEGADREDIDPHHSYDRPDVDNIDEENTGVR